MKRSPSTNVNSCTVTIHISKCTMRCLYISNLFIALQHVIKLEKDEKKFL